jgi:hypothetical protein
MKRVILLSVSILLICLAYSFAEVPCKINYQGRLIKDNVPVDGTKPMVFSIYPDAVGGSPIWTSSNVNVEVHNGLFRYVLDLSSIDDWTAGQELYLEVIVDGETLTPREELYSYPYAINSHLLEGRTTDYFLNTSVETQKKDGGLNIMGNVGIGMTNLGGILHIFDGNKSKGIMFGRRYGNDIQGSTGISGGDIDNLVLQSYGGNVGIGTTSPGEKLTVAGTIESTSGGVKFPDGSLQTTAAEDTQYVGTVIYNAVVPVTWTELDISSIVGQRSVMVFLRVKGGGNRHITITPYVDRAIFMRGWGVSNLYQYHGGPSNECSLLISYTDAAGKLGIVSWAYAAAWEITLIAYFK